MLIEYLAVSEIKVAMLYLATLLLLVGYPDFAWGASWPDCKSKGYTGFNYWTTVFQRGIRKMVQGQFFF